jgi:hypothetical protein
LQTFFSNKKKPNPWGKKIPISKTACGTQKKKKKKKISKFSNPNIVEDPLNFFSALKMITKQIPLMTPILKSSKLHQVP